MGKSNEVRTILAVGGSRTPGTLTVHLGEKEMDVFIRGKDADIGIELGPAGLAALAQNISALGESEVYREFASTLGEPLKRRRRVKSKAEKAEPKQRRQGRAKRSKPTVEVGPTAPAETPEPAAEATA